MVKVVPIIFGLAVFVASAGWAADDPFVCAGEGTAETYLSATDPLVVARIVFVAFPDEGAARQNLPSWASTLRAELADFINVMSHGQQNFDLQILTRPDDPTKAWIAIRPHAHTAAISGNSTRRSWNRSPLRCQERRGRASSRFS